MTVDIDREGVFRANIFDYSLNKSKTSEAKAVSIRAQLLEIWDKDDRAWIDWREANVVARGSLWIVKKDGSLNQGQIEGLVEHAGWDGSFTSILQGDWQPTQCQVQVKAGRDANGDQEFSISWLRDWDAVPGGTGGGNVELEEARKMDTKLASRVRAITGNAKRKKAPPPGSTPNKPAPANPPENQSNGSSEPPQDDEIPF